LEAMGADARPKEIPAQVFEAVSRFTGGAVLDDIAMLALARASRV
jgi:hypothetical protein